MKTISKKKILFVITKSNWGGAQRYVYDLATSLPKDEFEVSVAFGHPGLLAKKLDVARITTYPILSLQRDVSIIADVKSFFELLRLFRAKKFDIVHLNSSKAGGLGALAGRIVGVLARRSLGEVGPRIIFTAHGWPFWERRNVINRAFIYFFSWLTAIFSHVVITVSNYDLKMAQNMLFVRHKAVRIYNGIDTHMQFGSGEIIRNAFPPNAHITGTIGELNKNKNQQALIEQAKNNPEMFVAIVGEGEDRAYLEGEIKEYGLETRVKLFGFMPASEALRGFDVFALPSIKEGLPYVLLEARAVGLPIVANRVGGVSEILDAKDMSEFSLEQMVQKTIVLYS